MYYIYKVTNNINGKIYIGYTKNFRERKNRHKNSVNANSPFLFHQAIRKYGWDNFTWEILYESWDGVHCLEVMEPHFIAEYESFGKFGYNMDKGGRKGMQGLKRKPLTEEQKRKISERTKQAMNNPKLKEKLSNIMKDRFKDEKYKFEHSNKRKGKTSPMKGRTQTLEARQLISKKSKEMWQNEDIKNKILKHIQNPTQETRNKMSKSKIGKTPWNKGLKKEQNA